MMCSVCCSEWGWCAAVLQWGPIRIGRRIIEPLHKPPTRRSPSLVQNFPARRCLDARPRREVGQVDTPACDYLQHHHQAHHVEAQVAHLEYRLAFSDITAEGATRGDGVPSLAALFVKGMSASQAGGGFRVQLLHTYRAHIIWVVEEGGIEVVFGGHCGGVDSVPRSR